MKFLPILLAGAVWGQTQVDLRNQSRNVDFSGAVSTRPEKTGTALPATCETGQLFFQTSTAMLYSCAATNVWSAVGSGSGGGGTGGAGVCSASNTSSPNALNCTIPGFSLGAGATVNLSVMASTTSTAVTLAINGGAGAPILKGGGSAPDVGEIAPGSTPILLSFNGSAFQIVNDSYQAGGTTCLVVSRNVFPWTIDISPACVPELTGVNAFSGYNNFSAGQIRLPESAVAGLPPATTNSGKEFIVTDGVSAGDCTTGGGSIAVNLCRSNGLSWAYAGGSYAASIGPQSAVAMSSSPKALGLIPAVPALGAGACYLIEASVLYGSGNSGYTVTLDVDGSPVLTLLNGAQPTGSSGNGVNFYRFSYCNGAGAQNTQTAIPEAGSGYSAGLSGSSGIVPEFFLPYPATPAAANWANSHAIAVYASSAASGVTAQIEYLRVAQ